MEGDKLLTSQPTLEIRPLRVKQAQCPKGSTGRMRPFAFSIRPLSETGIGGSRTHIRIVPAPSGIFLRKLWPFCCKSRNPNDSKNLAKVDFEMTLRLQCAVAPIRGSVVIFLRNDVVPHVATRNTR
jgi:hypothetical protein